MTLRHMPLILLIAACTPQHVAIPPTSDGTARFSSYPTDLFAAVQAACEGPAQTFSRPEPRSVQCQELMPPDLTAALILTFDGTPEDLPRLVVRFNAEPEESGYLVRNDYFVSVPQRTGGTREVRQPDPGFARVVDALYRRAGGIPQQPADGATR